MARRVWVSDGPRGRGSRLRGGCAGTALAPYPAMDRSAAPSAEAGGPYNRRVHLQAEPCGSSRPARDLTLTAYTELLASGLPVPGGGSAAAVAGSLAASLIGMVARLCEGRPKFDIHRDTIEAALRDRGSARERFLALADEDAEAFAALSAARRLPKGTNEEAAERERAVAASRCGRRRCRSNACGRALT